MGSKTLKRLLTSLLSLSLLCTQFVTTTFAQPTNPSALTEAQVIVNNYDAELTAQEKDVLKNSGIKSEYISFDAPTAADNLVTLDGTTVTVADHTDEYGTEWKAVSAVLKVAGKEDAPITLTNGVGTINTTEKNYSIEVKYEAYANVSEETRVNLLNAAHYLVTGTAAVEKIAVDGAEAVEGLNAKISMDGDEYTVVGWLKKLVDGFEVYYPAFGKSATVQLGANSSYDSSAAIEAIEALYAQEQSGGYAVSKQSADYATYVGNEVAFIKDGKAESLKAAAIETRDYLQAIYDNAMVQGNELFDTIAAMRNFGATTEASALTSIMNDIGSIIAALNEGIDADWAILGVREAILSENVDSSLTAAVEAARDFTSNHAYEAKDLLLAEAKVVASMNRNAVHVVVNATVYEGADSTVLSKEDTLYIGTGTSFEDVESEITNGLEADAKNEWNDNYQVGETHYDRDVQTNVGDSLTADSDYTVTYTPKNYTVTSVSAPELAKEYPYGIQLTLPSGAALGLTYTYTVTDANGTNEYPENYSLRVVGDMTIERVEDKAKVNNRVLDVLAADINYSFSTDVKKILTNKALASGTISYKVPEAEDELLTLTINEGKYVLTAIPYASGYNGLVWMPVAYYVNGTRIEFDGTATIDDTSIKNVKVDYELAITDIDVDALLNDVEGLLEEASYQIEQMNRIGSKRQMMAENGSNVFLALGMLIDNIKYSYEDESGANYGKEMSDTDLQVIADLEFLRSECFKAKNMIIADYIYDGEDASFNNLKSYYTNSAIIREQLRYLTERLDADITKHPEFLSLLASNAQFSSYGDKIDDLVATLNEVYQNLAAPSLLVDVKSDSVNDLYRALATGASLGSVTSKGLTAYTSITVQGEGQLATKVTVNVENSKGEVIETVTSSELSFDATKTYTDEDIKAITDVIAALKGELTTELKYYNCEEPVGLPTVGAPVTKGEVTVTYAPKTVVVKIEGQTDTVLTIDSLTITLPAHPSAEYRYEYTVNGKPASAGEYNFSPAEFESLMATGTLNIVRTEINVGESNIVDLFSGLNAGMGNMESRFVVVKNPNYGKSRAITSKYAVVLRVATTELSSVQNLLMGIVTELTGSPYDYIAMGTNDDAHAIWGNDKVSIQAVINGVLESGIGFDTFIGLVDDNGNIIENVNSLVTGFDVIVGDGGDTAKLGGSLIESALFVGNDSSTVTEMPFYITVQDYDTQADNLLKLKKGLTAIKPYLDVNTDGNRLNAVVTAPDRLYQVMLAGLLVTGYADLDDISAVDFKAIVEYVKEQAEVAVLNKDVTAKTYLNTLDILNIDTNLAAHADTINTVLTWVRKIYNYAVISNEAYTNNSYAATVAADLMPILTDLGYDSFASMLKETTLSLPMAGTMTNVGTAYEAVVFDNDEAGLDKIYFAKDLSAVSGGFGGNAVVILLQDVADSVVLGNGIILDLNGKTIASLTSNNGTTKIFNSAFEADGGVTGAMTGNFNIAGGEYTADVSSMVVAGYSQTNGVVESDLYTAKMVGDKLVIELEADFIDPAREADLKYLAVDLAIQLALNFYTASKLNVDGSDIYAFEYEDVIDAFGGNTDLMNEALHIIDYAGLTTFTNTLIDDLTDWGALASKVETGEPLVSYDVETTPWGIALKHAKAQDYLTVSLKGDSSVNEEFTLEIRVMGNPSDSDNVTLAKLLKELENVLTIDAYVELNDLSYTNEDGFTADYMGDGNVTIDFTQAANGEHYTTLMGLILAYSNPSIKPAVQNYIDNGDVDGLIAAVDGLSVANVISAIKGIRGVSFAKLSNGYAASDVAYLESIYHVFLQGIAGVMNKLDVTGRDTKIGGLTTTKGVYVIDKAWKNITGTVTLKLFAEKAPELEPYAYVNTNILGWEIDYANKEIRLDFAVTDTTNGLSLSKFGEDFYVGFDVNSGVVQSTTFDQKTIEAGLIRNGSVVVVKYGKTATSNPIEETWTIKVVGDVNGNGLIESNDAALIAKTFVDPNFTLNAIQEWAADVNGEYGLDSNDALLNAYKWTMQTNRYTSKLRNVEEGK